MSEFTGGPNVTTTSEDTTPSDTNIALGWIVEVAIFLIIFENTLLLLTLKLHKRWKVVDLLVLSLSLADFLNAVFPLQALNVKANFLPGPWSGWLCGLFVWTTYGLRIVSLSTVTLMSVEQAMLLNQPLRYYTKMTFSFMRKLVVLTWGISAVIAALLKLLATTSNSQCRYQPFHLGLAIGIFVEAFGLVHFLIVLGSYVTMIFSSRGFLRRQRSMVDSQKRQRGSSAAGGMTRAEGSAFQQPNMRDETQGMAQVKQLCRVMGYVVLLYYLTWFPFLVYNLYCLLSRNTVYNKRMNTIVGICSLATPILNPLLYMKMVKRYRKGIVFILEWMASVCGRSRSLNNRNDKSQCFSLEAKLGSSSSKGDSTPNLSAKISTTTLVSLCKPEHITHYRDSEKTRRTHKEL